MNLLLFKKSHWKILCLSISFLLYCVSLGAQETNKITGTVYDESKEPLIGVSVIIRGTNVGTVTDTEGRFEISSDSKNPTLDFSYIGYTTKTVKPDGKTSLEVILSSDETIMDEVVVVGYGTQKRLSLTGSVGTVGAKDLKRTTATTTAAALAGKVPGITFRQTNGQPGQTMRMEIRNMGTPLYVIDGVMKDEGQFNNLDINDIESISVLKDGAAAIYGVKASNGVVLITTKRGKLNEKPTVNINAYYGVQNWTRFPKMSNAHDYTRAWSEADINTNGINSKGLTHEELAKWQSGYYNPETGEDYRSFDWYDFAVNKNSPQKYLNVSSSGGSDRTNYYFSISKMYQEAAFRDFNFNRSNFQTNIDTRISKHLKVGASMNGRIETRESPAIGDNYVDDYWRMRWGLNQNRPTERPYANDNPNYINKTYNIFTNEAYGQRDIVGTRDDVWRVFQGNWDVEWDTPLKGLTTNFMFSYYYANEQEDASKKEVLFYTYDKDTDAYSSSGSKISPASLRKRQRTIWENVYRFSVNYNNKFGMHDISAIFVAEQTERFDRNLRMINDKISNNFQTLFGKDEENNMIDTDTFSEVPTAGYIGRINYNYADKYLLELSGRYDGCFKFPPNKRWGFFPSVSAGWRISEESFFKNNGINNWMTNLKLRVSYGEMGDDNVGIGNYDHLTGYQLTSGGTVLSSNPFTENGGSSILIANAKGLPVTNITWITSSITNIGLDFGFLDNRLGVEIDGFYRKRSGLTAVKVDVVLPVETGYDVPFENLNTDMHMGVDGFVKWNDRIGDVQYFAGVNATFARKKDGNSYGQRFSDSWNKYRTSTQDRWSYINWGYEVVGRFQTQEEVDAYPVIMNVDNGSDRNMTVLPGDFIYKDQNEDGVINDFDRRPIGYAEGGLPYLTYGINLGAQWKGFDFAADFAGGAMQSFQQNYETKWPFQASGNTFNFMVNDRWHHEDPLDPSSPWVPGYYPALRLTPTDSWNVYCSNSEYWLTNVRYLRLRNLEIGYTIPRQITQKVSMERCRIYFSGTNVFSLDNLRKIGLDPENTDTNGLGYPNNKVFTLGVNVTF